MTMTDPMRLRRHRTLVICGALSICLFLAFSSMLGTLDSVSRRFGMQSGDTVYMVSRRGFARARATLAKARKATLKGLPYVDSWGAYSPYTPQDKYSVPDGCRVTMANILQRHGARYPTSGAAKRIQAALAKVQAVPAWSDEAHKFIPTWSYTLGQDHLVPFGARQSHDAGVEVAKRYAKLGQPFVRASESERVIDSAHNWTAGYSSTIHRPVPPTLIVSEEYNTTLDDSMCPTADDSSAQTLQWASTVAPAFIARLKSFALPPESLTLTDADVPSLLSLCPFDTLAGAKFETALGHETASPWCGIFSRSEAAQFEYYMDLDKYYGTGYGNALGPVQGIGYVAEILARLTRTPVSKWDKDVRTSVNHTLDDNAQTFPLDRALYVDFSHDNHMVAILAALGALKQSAPLSTTDSSTYRTWVISHMVPFGGHIVFEKLQCRTHGVGWQPFTRVLVNDKAVQLPKPCSSESHGKLCALDDFVASQTYVKSGAQEEWRKCRAESA